MKKKLKRTSSAMNKSLPLPDLQINIFLVEYGYQLDIINSKTMQGQSICRDFGGNYKIDKTIKVIEFEIKKLFSNLEGKLK